MSTTWQVLLALDARYNAHRTPNNLQFKTLYIRRRSQLLRDNHPTENDVNIRKQYLRLRSSLLASRYGANLVDSRSIGSHASRMNSISESADSFADWTRRNTTLAVNQILIDDIPETNLTTFSTSSLSNVSMASRALAMGRSLEETYAFSGVHHIFDHHKGSVTRVQFAPNDRSLLATCGRDGILAICQVLPTPATIIYRLKGHTAAINDMQWSSINDLLVTASSDSSIRIWQISNGKCMRVIESKDGVENLCCCFHPSNNNFIAVGNNQGILQIFNVSTGKALKNCVIKCYGRSMCVAFDETGSILWTGDSRGNILAATFDMTTGKLHSCKRVFSNSNGSVTSLSFRYRSTRDGREGYVLANVIPNLLFLFKVVGASGKLIVRKRFPIRQKSLSLHSSFCPIVSQRQGFCVVSGSEDMCVYLYDVDREVRTLINKLQGHCSVVFDASFNTDESLLASCDQQGLVIVWQRDSR
ncbi:unnamed protein product [Rotaria socialis]|uniref:WD repeat-containing protein 13 n=2 Tax=Rotaria socialis TaxID=392032 RepID=A0A818J0W6_9BILA|nr:unnamed protein product [Rotaria socialis]CAF3608004.1 unnamed protein product [Rotaria socialis]CAF4480359.1 unnamed protein product [Rotaria socialis]CAF4721270.1 unnamed protein product [Rotaria socialis]